jgi:hypothetical protein
MMEQQIQMYALVEEWKSSNLTKGDFAVSKSVTYHSFNYWIQKYNKEHSRDKSEISFFSAADKVDEIKKAPSLKSVGQKTMSIELPNGIKITIY